MPHPKTCKCDGSGRIPDVTTDKVLRLGICLWYDDTNFAAPTFVATHRTDPTNPFFGDTPELAACAALLASVEVKP